MTLTEWPSTMRAALGLAAAKFIVNFTFNGGVAAKQSAWSDGKGE